MNIAKVLLKKDKGWKKLEDVIQKYDSSFTFSSDTIYKFQILEGAVLLCEGTSKPTNGGFLYHKLGQIISYKKGEGDLYIIPTNFDRAVINIGDEN